MSHQGMTSRNHPNYGRDADDGVDDRATHPLVFAELHERFRFTVDAAASDANAKLPRYWTRHTDGLTQPWAGERVWCNPPFSDIGPWCEKAWAEPGATVVMLVPANRTEQPWWQRYVEPYRDRPGSPLRVEFLPGRMRFLKPGQTAVGPHERPTFGVALLIWRDITFRPDHVTGGLFTP